MGHPPLTYCRAMLFIVLAQLNCSTALRRAAAGLSRRLYFPVQFTGAKFRAKTSATRCGTNRAGGVLYRYGARPPLRRRRHMQIAFNFIYGGQVRTFCGTWQDCQEFFQWVGTRRIADVLFR